MCGWFAALLIDQLGIDAGGGVRLQLGSSLTEPRFETVLEQRLSYFGSRPNAGSESSRGYAKNRRSSSNKKIVHRYLPDLVGLRFTAMNWITIVLGALM